MSELTPVEIVNGSKQTIRVALDAEGLDYARKRLQLGEFESLTVLADTAAAPRKTTTPKA